MDIFQMSFSAAFLIIAVIIIRAFALHRLPKKTFLVLWGVVICRLLIPFSIPSRLSFYTGVDMLRRAITAETAYIPAPAVLTGTPAMEIVDMGKLAATGASTISISMSPLISIWIAGICICTIFFLLSYIKCRREFQTALPVENDFINRWQQRHPLRRTVQIRQSDRIKAPLTYGVRHPVVLLPKAMDWTDETILQYILTHEYVHIRRFDALAKLLITSAVCIHWFNPLVWVMYMLANRDIELACDESVVRAFGDTAKSTYALALIGLEEKKSRLIPLCNNFSKIAIEERITSIMKIKKYSLPVIIVAVLLIAGVTVGFACSKATVGQNSYLPEKSEELNPASPSPASEKTLVNDGETIAEPASNNDGHSSSSEIRKVYYSDGQHKTEIDGVPVHPVHCVVIGKYYYKRIDRETGKNQVSFDDGSTWLWTRNNPKSKKIEVSADGVTWKDLIATIQEPKYSEFCNHKYFYMRSDPDTGQELASFDDGVTWLFYRENVVTGRAEISSDGVKWREWIR